MEATPGFSGLKITNYYKYLLYLNGVILVLSLFVPAQDLDNERIRRIAFWLIMAGLLIWFIHEIIQKTDRYYYATLDKHDYNLFVVTILFVEYLSQIAIWIIAWISLF